MALFESLKGAKYASQIILQSAQPLDARNVVDTYDDLQLLIDENGAYEGMSVYVKDEKKKYTLKDLPTADWSAESKLDAVFVTELPTSYANYTFDTDTAFTAVERCSAAITTDGTEKYLTVTSASNAGNKYGLAQLDFSGISENAASIVIEMDFRIPGGRWYIGLVDLSKHPGTSHTMTYDDTGVVFHHGTKDGGNYCINGANKYDVNFLNIWLTMKAVIDIINKTVTYKVTGRESGNILAEGKAAFKDTGTDNVTGIELYTWTECSIDIDNIKIAANIGVNEKTVYITGYDNAHSVYMYKNGEPQLIAAASSIENYSRTPQRTGTWIDGTPVWKVAFDINFEENSLGVITGDPDISLLAIFQTILPRSAFDDMAIIRGSAVLRKGNGEYYTDYYSPLLSEGFKIPSDFSTTRYFSVYGWIEFATPESNISTA